ncbi:hypothetical protein [Streptomyces sp. NPDC097981]|uniref:hypothetical protein n=1 Tax=Streptomyces sp. NPDC097981 TaxID=3155428 RepID=UPI00332FBC13
MTIAIAFFIAPDDATAAATRNRGPGHVLPSVVCKDFYPDDAVVEWEMYFEAPSPDLPSQEELNRRSWPHYVADVVNDGSGVFAVSEQLTYALAEATLSQLRGLSARWTARLWVEDGDEMTDDNPLAVLTGVAGLAQEAVGSGGGLRLYCRHC